jgi:hypothetical protein
MDETHTCFLVAVDQRIDDARTHWLEAEAQYFDPGAFRLRLNACIQTLRTVTFVLQKQKSVIPQFEQWYETWQERMRRDDVLRWLIESRNKIEKQGDLETHSRAIIGIYDSWLRPPLLQVKVKPSMPPRDFAQMLASLSPRCMISEGALLKVERRWVDSELPEREILEAIYSGYASLLELVVSAHRQCNLDETQIVCPWFRKFCQGDQSDSIKKHQQSKITWVSLEDCSARSISVKTKKVTRRMITKVVRKRYHLPDKLDNLKGFSLEEQAKGWFEIAKVALKRDGYHYPMAILRTADSAEVLQLRMDDRAGKQLAIRTLGELAAERKAVAVFFINEAWIAPFDPAHPDRHAKDHPNRTEALVVHAVNRQKQFYSCNIGFSKHGRKIEFTEEHFGTGWIAALQPILDAWGTGGSAPAAEEIN